MQTDNEQMRTRTTAMAASIRTQSQAEIRSNNSLLRNLTITNLPGVQVRQDGDVIRVEMPADQLFNAGTAQLKNGADETLRSVGADLVRNYPQQMIGIEGHTDNSLIDVAAAPTDQHLSVAQAMAVYDALVRASAACRPASCSSSATAPTTRSSRTPPTRARPAIAGSSS